MENSELNQTLLKALKGCSEACNGLSEYILQAAGHVLPQKSR